MASTQRSVLTLYRQILRNVKYYPSSKRASIEREVKESFRASRGLEDPDKVAKELQQARIGLQELEMWKPQNLQDHTGGWSVNLRGNTLCEDQDARTVLKK